MVDSGKNMYMSAIFQAFMAIDELGEYFIKQQYNDIVSEELSQICTLIKQVYAENFRGKLREFE